MEALEAAVPAPSLVAAVLARQMSMLRGERMANAASVALPKVQQVGWGSVEVNSMDDVLDHIMSYYDIYIYTCTYKMVFNGTQRSYVLVYINKQWNLMVYII